MSLTVFSIGPKGPASIEVRKLSEVEIVANRVIQEGHKEVRIGGGVEEDALDFETWKIAVQGVSAGSI